MKNIKTIEDLKALEEIKEIERILTIRKYKGEYLEYENGIKLSMTNGFVQAVVEVNISAQQIRMVVLNMATREYTNKSKELVNELNNMCALVSCIGQKYQYTLTNEGGIYYKNLSGIIEKVYYTIKLELTNEDIWNNISNIIKTLGKHLKITAWSIDSNLLKSEPSTQIKISIESEVFAQDLVFHSYEIFKEKMQGMNNFFSLDIIENESIL